MRKPIVIGVIIVAVVFALYYYYNHRSNRGSEVKINDNISVYIQKDATEEEAKTLGSFLVSSKLLNEPNQQIQLQRENDLYTVRLVVDEDHVKQDPNIDARYQPLQKLLREQVFPGKTVRLILSDGGFRDYKTISDPNPANSDNGMPATPPGTKPDTMKAAPGSPDSTTTQQQRMQQGQQQKQ